MDQPNHGSGPPGASRAALDCYLSAILMLADFVAEVDPDGGALYRERLIRLRRRLAFAASPKALEENRTALKAELLEFAARVVAELGQRRQQALGVLSAVNATTESITARQQFYASRLRQFADWIEETPLSPDKEEVAEAIGFQAASLRGCVESMTIDTASLLDRLCNEVAAAERLALAGASESVDPLTGLASRAETERILRRALAGGGPVSVLSFAIRNLDQIGQDLGSRAAGEIIRQFAARLVEQVRPRDHVGRWTEECFVVVFACRREDALSRLAQIARWLSGVYTVPPESDDSAPQRAKVEVASEVTECDAEIPEQLFQRLSPALVA